VLSAPEAGIEFNENLSTEPKMIRFTPTKAGSYPFYCSKKLLFLESHRQKGMEGMLSVVE
jgi:plastocyanin